MLADGVYDGEGDTPQGSEGVAVTDADLLKIGVRLGDTLGMVEVDGVGLIEMEGSGETRGFSASSTAGSNNPVPEMEYVRRRPGPTVMIPLNVFSSWWVGAP
jgi:hypothetical protein